MNSTNRIIIQPPHFGNDKFGDTIGVGSFIIGRTSEDYHLRATIILDEEDYHLGRYGLRVSLYRVDYSSDDEPTEECLGLVTKWGIEFSESDSNDHLIGIANQLTEALKLIADGAI